MYGDLSLVIIAVRHILSAGSNVDQCNCSGERSFSLLKRVKNVLRSTMSQDRLTALSLLSIESEILRSLNFEDIIHEFATAKARKMQILGLKL